MLWKITEGSAEEEVIVGVQCIEFTPPPAIQPPTTPAPPPIVIGGGLPPPPPDGLNCQDVQVVRYKDGLGYCWQALVYPCVGPLQPSVVRSPIDCADL